MSRSRWLPSPFFTIVLAFIWLLLANNLTLGNCITGLLFGWLIPLITQDFWTKTPKVRHPLKLLLFFLLILGDIVRSNWQVALLVLKPTKNLRPSFIEVPLDVSDEWVLTLLASIISLTPGTVSADLSSDNSVLLVHVLDVDDEQLLVEAIKKRYEASLLEIFE